MRALLLLLLVASAAFAQPLPPPTTPYTRAFLRSTNDAAARTSLGIVGTNLSEVTLTNSYYVTNYTYLTNSYNVTNTVSQTNVTELTLTNLTETSITNLEDGLTASNLTLSGIVTQGQWLSWAGASGDKVLSNYTSGAYIRIDTNGVAYDANGVITGGLTNGASATNVVLNYDLGPSPSNVIVYSNTVYLEVDQYGLWQKGRKLRIGEGTGAGLYGIAIGYQADTGLGDIAIGAPGEGNTRGDGGTNAPAIAIGMGATAIGANAIAIGSENFDLASVAYASGSNTVEIGNGSASLEGGLNFLGFGIVNGDGTITTNALSVTSFSGWTTNLVIVGCTNTALNGTYVYDNVWSWTNQDEDTITVTNYVNGSLTLCVADSGDTPIAITNGTTLYVTNWADCVYSYWTENTLPTKPATDTTGIFSDQGPNSRLRWGFTSANSRLAETSRGNMEATTAISGTWLPMSLGVPPASATLAGSAFFWNSNGVVYLLTTENGASTTWGATNKLAP